VTIDRGDVVIAEHGFVRARTHARETSVGVGAIPDDITQAQDAIVRIDTCEDRVERFEIAVNVGYDCVRHRGAGAFASECASASAKAVPKRARSGAVPTVTRM